MTLLAVSLLLGFAFTILAPWLHQRFPRHAAWMALFPLSIFLQLCLAIPAIAAGESWQLTLPWVPSLGLSLSLRLDGLGLVMALLISGIGAMVIVCGGAYLQGHPFLGRF